MNVRESFAAQPKSLILLEAAVFIFAVVCLDYATPWELSLFVFYAFPIFIVGWFGGTREGVAFAIICAVVSWGVNLRYDPDFALYTWRAVNRLISFLFVAACGIAIRRQREIFQSRMEAIERTRELEKDIVQISEREQMRIGQDLHDGLCQTLSAIDCATECLKTTFESRSLPEATDLGQIQTLLKNANAEARSLARGIAPVRMDAAGFPAALEELVAMMQRSFQIPIVLEIDDDLEINDSTVAMHLYRITQEALSNALRHAGATEVRVSVRQKAGRLTLSISDDGDGIAPSDAHAKGMGLRTIRYRAGLIGAEVDLSFGTGSGAQIRCSLPMETLRQPQA